MSEVALFDAGPVAGSVDALWTQVHGQPSAVATLRAAARMPVHAYLLVGPPGVGKQAAATAFAAALLCPRGGCGACEVCSRVTEHLHPDVTVVAREGASITVPQAREIIRLASRSPVEGARKVLVLVDLHLVGDAAATLLKIVEEPPASTVFVILAEHVAPELVTIASRCVQVPFRPLASGVLADVLAREDVDEGVAVEAARASGGRLDRARLLAADPGFRARREFWQLIPRRLDGTGAAVAVVAGEAVAMLDAAAVAPLEERQRAEVEALDARLEAAGPRGSIGQRKDLVERHKRELKRLRDDELRYGLTVLQGAYRDAVAAGGVEASGAVRAVAAIGSAVEGLERNPNLTLFLQALLLRLPPLR